MLSLGGHGGGAVDGRVLQGASGRGCLSRGLEGEKEQALRIRGSFSGAGNREHKGYDKDMSLA